MNYMKVFKFGIAFLFILFAFIYVVGSSGLYEYKLNETEEEEKAYIDFSANDKFMENMEKLIQKCIDKTKYIVISLNNKTSPSSDELKQMLEKYGKVSVKYKDFQYKVTGKENKNTTVEILIIVKLKSEIN